MDRTITQQSTYVDKLKNFATSMVNLLDRDGNVLLREWNGGMNALLTDPAAFAGTPHDKDDVTALLVTLNALMTLMDAGHRDNLYNMAK